jgi:hypothetical protein
MLVDIDTQKQADFQSQYKQLCKSQGVFKFQQLEKDQASVLSRSSGYSIELVKSFETSIKIGRS